jgi:LysM repeat protein
MKAFIKRPALIWLALCCVAGAQSQTYTVKPGDSLSKIARTQGCSVDALVKANSITLSTVIKPGLKLKIPGAQHADKPAPAMLESHVIAEGDTFSSISKQYGIPLETLIAANPSLDPKSLKLGQMVSLKSNKVTTSQEPGPNPETPPQVTTSASEIPAKNEPTPAKTGNPGADNVKTRVQSVTIDKEISYGEFAAKYGTDIERLNELNGLTLSSATVLAKGSELYVPVSQ